MNASDNGSEKDSGIHIPDQIHRRHQPVDVESDVFLPPRNFRVTLDWNEEEEAWKLRVSGFNVHTLAEFRSKMSFHFMEVDEENMDDIINHAMQERRMRLVVTVRNPVMAYDDPKRLLPSFGSLGRGRGRGRGNVPIRVGNPDSLPGVPWFPRTTWEEQIAIYGRGRGRARPRDPSKPRPNLDKYWHPSDTYPTQQVYEVLKILTEMGYYVKSSPRLGEDHPAIWRLREIRLEQVEEEQDSQEDSQESQDS